jgi:D-lactate dehydrogenase
MKIAFFEVEGWEKKYLESKLAGHELKFFTTHLTKDNAKDVADFEVISVFLMSHLTPEVLDQLPKLRLVTTRSTGFDHIDCPTCYNRKITVSNVPHYGTHTVAEHAFALILALSRKIVASVERTQKGDFDHRELTGFDLFGKTLGIVGLGDIGMSVLNIAKGFGMKVAAYAHHPDEALARKLGISFLSIPELFKVSDVVTLHVPYMKETHHLVNIKNIKKFKKGSVLINTARGGLVETEAIIYGLEKGILGGFGSDVLEEEDIIKEERQILSENFLNATNIKTLYLDHVLMGQENVVLTPHNAFNSVEALHMILDITIDNILQFEKNNPQNTVK